jgi:glycosyltransferase involved in cell wall biosynthesis
MISVIIPTFNESKHGYLDRILEFWESNLDGFEIIIVDSGSTDETLSIVQKYKFVKIINTSKPNRPGRLNDGATIAQGQYLLFHHPVSLLDKQAIESMVTAVQQQEFVWGAFQHKFDTKHFLLTFTSFYSNFVRGKLKGIFYLDHCLLVDKIYHEKVGGWPEDDIFEDTIYSRSLRKIKWPRLLKGASTTSARRFKKRGMYKHAILNQVIKIMFELGFDRRKINLIYEGKNPFNVKY